jgi:flagellar biosynthesis/type III secretory pathway protein FliH
VNNRDEYRDPHLQRDQQEAYREGFRRGYERGVSHLVGGPQEPVGPAEQPMPGASQQMRDPDRGGPGMGMGMSQELGSDIQRRGFHDGLEGARKDLDNHRQPNVNNRDEYRHPGVPHGMRNEYREGFRHGYDRGMSQMMSGQMAEHDGR